MNAQKPYKNSATIRTDMTALKKTGLALKEARLNKGLTQAEVAEKADLHPEK